MAIGNPSEKLRLRMYDLTGGLCEYCGTDWTDLHHNPYKSQPGAKNDVDHLLALCRRCHDWAHRKRDTKLESQYKIYREWYDNLPLHKLNSRRTTQWTSK